MKIVLVKGSARGLHRIVFGLCNIMDGLVNILSFGFLQSSFSLEHAKKRAMNRFAKDANAKARIQP